MSTAGTSVKTKTTGKAATTTPPTHRGAAHDTTSAVVQSKKISKKTESTPVAVLQAKLAVGEPNDVHEQQADAMADKVLRMSGEEAHGRRANTLRDTQAATVRLSAADKKTEKREQPGSFLFKKAGEEKLKKAEQKPKEEQLKKKEEKKPVEEKIRKAPELVQAKVIPSSAVVPKEKEKLEKKEAEKRVSEEKIKKSPDKQPVPKYIPSSVVVPKEKEKLEKKEAEKKVSEEKIKKSPDKQPVPKYIPSSVVVPKEKEKLEKKETEKKVSEEKVKKSPDKQPVPKYIPSSVVVPKEKEKLDKKEEKKGTEEKIQRAPEKLQPKTAPVLSFSKDEEKLKKKETEKQVAEKIQKAEQKKANNELSPGFESRLNRSFSGGFSMPRDLREYMEPRFEADFSTVRLHTDPEAQQLAKDAGARAFAYGNHIYFSKDQYDPDSSAGRWLLAHELTHVVQQGHAGAPEVARETAEEKKKTASAKVQAMPEGVSAAPQSIQKLGLSDVLDGLAALAANIPGFTLLTVIIGRNPINMAEVDRSPVNILRGFIGLIPGGELMFQVLSHYNVVQRIANWVGEQVTAMGISYSSLRDAFTRFTDSLGWRDIFSPGDVWRRAQNIFTPFITRITSFVAQLIAQAITWLKETFMQPLSAFCHEIPGFGLVSVLLGHDPFTNAPVPRTAMNVVRAFAEFIPGGTEKVQQLEESHALEKAYDWFIQETQARNLTWARVTGTFSEAWNSLHLEDVLSPIQTIRRIAGIFSPLLTDLVGFAGAALIKLLEFIFEAVMGARGARVLALMKRSQATFLTIIRNPVGFFGNLVSAVGMGIRNFGSHILRHLQTGVITWLTGTLSRAGVELPQVWDLRGILQLIMSILGLTWPRIRAIASRVFGERIVAALETVAGLVMDIREKGFVQTMRDRLSEYFSGLREMVLGRIKSFIQERIVMSGIQYLVSLLSPVGAVIQAIMKTYETVKFFLDKIDQILDFVESVVNSISNIAAGSLGQAASYIEQTLARTIPLILDFLARMIGLGNISGRIRTVIEETQAFIAQKIEQGFMWVRTQVQRLITAGRSAVSRLFEWWTGRKSFNTRDGNTHNLFMRRQGNSARVMVASDEQQVETFLQNHAAKDTTHPQHSTWQNASSIYNRIPPLIANLAAMGTPAANDPAAQAQINNINTEFNNLAPVVAELGFDNATRTDTASPVNFTFLESMAMSIPLHPTKDMNRAGGHIWIHFKNGINPAVANFGVSERLSSGETNTLGYGGTLLKNGVNAQLQRLQTAYPQLRFNQVTRPLVSTGITGRYRGRTGHLEMHTESMVATIARHTIDQNQRTIQRVDIKVFTDYMPCAYCLDEVSGTRYVRHVPVDIPPQRQNDDIYFRDKNDTFTDNRGARKRVTEIWEVKNQDNVPQKFMKAETIT